LTTLLRASSIPSAAPLASRPPIAVPAASGRSRALDLHADRYLGSRAKNGFRRFVGSAPIASSGAFRSKIGQAIHSTWFMIGALVSKITGGGGPGDEAKRRELASLSPTVPIASEPIAKKTYSSHIPGATAKQAFELFVSRPNAVFAAEGSTLRPAIETLTDGARVFVEQGGFPPLWMPIEIRLDPAKNAIRIVTLDGHLFRATNDFTFTDDGKGGVLVKQQIAFQASSQLVPAGMALLRGEKTQDEGWRRVHELFYRALSDRGARLSEA
jgi:hypothetical protein